MWNSSGAVFWHDVASTETNNGGRHIKQGAVHPLFLTLDVIELCTSKNDSTFLDYTVKNPANPSNAWPPVSNFWGEGIHSNMWPLFWEMNDESMTVNLIRI